MKTFCQDLRFAVRNLRKSPGFAAVAIVSLAIGIGANTTIFSLIEAIFLRPLPVEDPSRLVSMYTADRKNPGYLACSWANYEEFRDHNAVFSALALYLSIPLSLTGNGEPEPVAGQIVTGNYFHLLGVRPAAGRFFIPEEDRVPGAHPVVVISHGLWMRRFGGDPQIAGATIGLNNRPYTVVGVAPRDFRGVNLLVTAEVWVPTMMYEHVLPNASWFRQRRALLFIPVGRLKPGISMEQAEASMKGLAAQLEREYPRENEGRSVRLVPLAQSAIQPNQRAIFVRTGALLASVSGLVLLIACTNIANLLLARAAGRAKEIAVRLSMGSGRGRIVRQLLTESALLAAAGGLAGLVLARWARDTLWAARPDYLAGAEFHPSLNAGVLGFTLAISSLTGLIFGLVPALRATRTNLAVDLKERSGQAVGVPSPWSLRRLLVATQMALSLVALAGAGLFVRSLLFAQRIEPGFDTSHLLVTGVNVATQGYDEARGREFQRRLLDRVRSLPNVESASLASNAPFRGGFARTIFLEGQDSSSGAEGLLTMVDTIGGEYFKTVRIPIVKGRSFTNADNASAPRVAIVNETMARRYWPGREALGERFRFFSERAPVEVAGIVRDANYIALGEEPRALAYLPLAQNYTGGVILHVRTACDPASLLGAVKGQVRALDPNLRLNGAYTVPQIIHEALWAPRTGAALLGIFGILALLLAIVGVYGVVSYSVNQRVREIGIRMALGATPRDVLGQVMREGMTLAAGGLAVGLAAALLAGRALTGLLFGISPTDPATYCAAILLLLAATVAACWFPARRATRIEPTEALRHE